MTATGVNPNWVPDPQGYAVDQERWRHNQAVYAYGEYVIFCLLWRIRDFEAGLVDRCALCYLSMGKIAETYAQPAQERCPECFGTTFEGGYKALIVRPAMWTFTEDRETASARGVAISASATVQTTSDFNVTNGDYLFRGDMTRWQLGANDAPPYLVTGFQAQTYGRHVVANSISAVREDESSVAFMIPPDAESLVSILDKSLFHFPLDFSAVEVIRGPLM